jgi:hypothetical protein
MQINQALALSGDRLSQPFYNDSMAETKPFRLTESVKAAG